jgi:hypothetical protein
MSIGQLSQVATSLRASIVASLSAYNPTALILTGLALVIAYTLIKVYLTPATTATRPSKAPINNSTSEGGGSVMSAPRTDLAPPRDDPFTLEQLKEYDGKTQGKPIYVAVKGSLHYKSSLVHAVCFPQTPVSTLLPRTNLNTI